MHTNNTQIQAPNASLENLLIEEFLESRGHTRRSVRKLAAAEASAVLRAANEHASVRLAEIEARARYIQEIHRPS